MPEPLRCCPWCATVTTAAACRNHGKNMSIPTLTLKQLRDRLARYRADAVGIKAAIAALESNFSNSEVANGTSATAYHRQG
jgi:hypothetical protein